MWDKFKQFLDTFRDPDLAVSLFLYVLTALLACILYWSAPVFLSLSASPTETSSSKGRR